MYGGSFEKYIDLCSRELEFYEMKVASIQKKLPDLLNDCISNGYYQKAIEIGKIYTDRYKRDVWSYELFSAISDAYCKKGDIETAEKFDDLAKKIKKC